MKTDTKVCIGVTIAILAALIIGGTVSLGTVEATLAIIGFLFLMGLPTYVWARRRDDQTRNDVDYEQRMVSARHHEVVQEIEDCLDDSIEEFKNWGWWIRELEKTDEKWFYTLCAEAGMDSRRLSAEYGKDVSYLINIRRKLRDIG